MRLQILTELFLGIGTWGGEVSRKVDTAVGKAFSLFPGACPLSHCSKSSLKSVDQQHQDLPGVAWAASQVPLGITKSDSTF